MKTILTVIAIVVFGSVFGTRAQSQAPSPTPPPAPIIPAKVIEDVSSPAGWRRYQFGVQPAFSVILPAAPETSAERAPSMPTAVVQTYMSTNENGVYGASRMDGLPDLFDNATEERRKGFFESYIGGFARGFRDTLKKNNLNLETTFDQPITTTAAGRSGFQQDFAVGPLKGRGQLVFAGSSAFFIVAIWPPDTPPSILDAFFTSFRLVRTPK